jgi:hypothetical protein
MIAQPKSEYTWQHFLDQVNWHCTQPGCTCQDRKGYQVVAHCPLPDRHNLGDATPSLSIKLTNHRIILNCFGANCKNAYEDLVHAFEERGVWPENGYIHEVGEAAEPLVRSEQDQAGRDDYIMWLWRQTVKYSKAGTPLDLYLQRRGLGVFLDSVYIGYNPKLKHKPTDTYWPGMVALIGRDLWQRPCGIHRTYLTRDGFKAPLEPNRMAFGDTAGGLISLLRKGQRAGDTIVVGEGIETAMSGGLLFNLPAFAAVSTSVLAQSKARISLPPSIKTVHILVDNDAKQQGLHAANAAAYYWQQQGITVIRRMPSTPGWDYNDVLMSNHR